MEEQIEYIKRQVAAILQVPLDPDDYETTLPNFSSQYDSLNAYLQGILSSDESLSEKLRNANVRVDRDNLDPNVRRRLKKVLSIRGYNKLVNWARHTQ